MTTAYSGPEIEAVLFDMGGVIVRLDSLENVLGTSALGPDEIWNRWILCDAVQQFERGQCDVDEFGAAILAELELEGTVDEFVERFTAFPLGLYPGAPEMVASVPDTVVTAVLSNTSAIHWENQIDAEIVHDLCDREYLSYALGLAKPEREIFDYAIADLGFPADRILFIDDNQINVDGALVTGLQAGLAKGPAEAAVVLAQYGVVVPS